MHQPTASQDRTNIDQPEILTGALPPLYRCAMMYGKHDLLLTMLAHWLTPKEHRPNPILPHPEARQELILTFVRDAKDFATSEQKKCLEAILQCRSALDFAPGDSLLGRM
jgi:hypothetical protein